MSLASGGRVTRRRTGVSKAQFMSVLSASATNASDIATLSTGALDNRYYPKIPGSWEPSYQLGVNLAFDTRINTVEAAVEAPIFCKLALTANCPTNQIVPFTQIGTPGDDVDYGGALFTATNNSIQIPAGGAGYYLVQATVLLHSGTRSAYNTAINLNRTIDGTTTTINNSYFQSHDVRTGYPANDNNEEGSKDDFNFISLHINTIEHLPEDAQLTISTALDALSGSGTVLANDSHFQILKIA